jgi:hypothetical protein
VLFMTTIDNSQDTIQRPRKRPKTKDPYVKAVWGPNPIKQLDIPTFIDRYNHNMNAVDLADQLRTYYSSDRHTFRTWRPLFDFMLQASIVNAAKLWVLSGGRSTKQSGHLQYRMRLANQLLSHIRSGKPQDSPSDSQDTENASICQHKVIFMSPRQCTSCKAFGRPPLRELSQSEMNERSIKRRDLPRTHFGCELHKIAICNNRVCWLSHTRK